MKTIDEYMKLPYKMEIVEDTADGGFVASFPDLRGCLTYADTVEKAIEAAKEAKYAWLKAAIEDGYDIPVPNTDDTYSGQFKLRIPKSLHRQLSEYAKREGISMNQYCLYLLAKRDAAYTVRR